jgi:hypothetical protein
MVGMVEGEPTAVTSSFLRYRFWAALRLAHPLFLHLHPRCEQADAPEQKGEHFSLLILRQIIINFFCM